MKAKQELLYNASMRDALLNPYFASVEHLSGVGPKVFERLSKLGCSRVIDLIFHKPVSYIDRKHTPRIDEAESGKIATFKVNVVQHVPPPRHGMPYKIICENSTGMLELIFFHYKTDYFSRLLPEGEVRLVSGMVENYGTIRQMAHPDHIVPEHKKADIFILEPQYPLTFGISHKILRKMIMQPLAKLPALPEWNGAAKISFLDAVKTLHNPNDVLDENVIQRLAYDELFAGQLAKASLYARVTQKPGAKVNRQARELKLPYSLTGDQQKALDDIRTDMRSGNRMFRLLQGDVGSGKTIVALLAALDAVASGTQTVLMMPTTLLAIQQKANIEKLVEGLGLRVELLTSNEKGKTRERILEGVANGEVDILIGTHALVQDWVNFKNLGLAVIDEQHRFGVMQRLKLTEKNEQAHILLMTATPIPRTLSLAYYGEMQISYIREKPAMQKPVQTYVMPSERIDEIKQRMKAALDAGEKIYWICPLIEESEKSDLAAAKDRYAELKAQFGDKVGLVHGRMKEKEKDDVLKKFLSGEHKILVATTVIEVGINVPDATIMFIEHAERFGLSQLHQLRGRVGRGEKESKCILLYSGNLSETSAARLKIIKNSTDGFVIAEEDLKLRGSGEVLGTKQSGWQEFKFAEFPRDIELLEQARNEAISVIKSGKVTPAHKILLSLFEYDESVDYVNAG